MAIMSDAAPPPPTRRGVPLKDRPTDTATGRPPPATAPGKRHCWVSGPAESPGPWPGLILEWQRNQEAGAWRARMTWVVDEGPEPVLVQQWLPSGLVRPA